MKSVNTLNLEIYGQNLEISVLWFGFLSLT